MKTSSILPVVAFVALSAVLFTTPVRADDPPAPVKLTPEVQALLKDLLKQMDVDPEETKPQATPAAPTAPPATAPATSSTPVTAPKTEPAPSSTSLRTGSLQTSGLQPSASLGGRGMAGGTPRLSIADWRLLFPLRDQK